MLTLQEPNQCRESTFDRLSVIRSRFQYEQSPLKFRTGLRFESVSHKSSLPWRIYLLESAV